MKPHNSSIAHTGRDGGVIVIFKSYFKEFFQQLALLLLSKKVLGLFCAGAGGYRHVRAFWLPPAVCSALQRADGMSESSLDKIQKPLQPQWGMMVAGDGWIQLKGSNLFRKCHKRQYNNLQNSLAKPQPFCPSDDEFLVNEFLVILGQPLLIVTSCLLRTQCQLLEIPNLSWMRSS